MRRAGQGGQIMPLAALALLAGALLAYGIVRTALSFHARTLCQTGADATALAAGTAYARGLNICAASNQMLVPASILDALRALSGSPPIFVPMVMKFQDAWAGTSSLQSLVVGAGLAPLYMQSVALGVGSENGLYVEAFWNGGVSPAGKLPDLGVKRASPIDLALWLAGESGEAGPGGLSGDVVFEREIEKETFSYRPESGGPRVEVPAGQVEEIAYESGGKRQTRYRMKAPKGGKAGRFVSRRTVTEKVVRSFPVPMPLIETVSMHKVLIVGRSARAEIARACPVAVRAQAQAGRGKVFSAFMGDPSFDVRLIPAGEGSGPDAGGPASSGSLLRLAFMGPR